MSTPESQLRAPEPAVAGPAATTGGGRVTGFGWLWFFLGLTALVLACGVVGWLLFLRPAEKAASSVRDAVANALTAITGQRVVIQSNTVTLEKSNISELNVVQRRTQTITKVETSLLGSTATLIMRGEFIVKAGFDLTKPFSVTVNEQTGEVMADFPPAKITSVEMVKDEIYYSDNGLITRNTPEITKMAYGQMLTQARLEAERSDIKEEAEAQLAQRLKDLLNGQASKLSIRGEEALP
jgi:hypothetical protein